MRFDFKAQVILVRHFFPGRGLQTTHHFRSRTQLTGQIKRGQIVSRFESSALYPNFRVSSVAHVVKWPIGFEDIDCKPRSIKMIARAQLRFLARYFRGVAVFYRVFCHCLFLFRLSFQSWYQLCFSLL